MGLSLTVNGEKVKFDLTDYEIKGYEFSYSSPDSQHAKGHEDRRLLKITGDISKTVKSSKEVMELIRNWAKTEYTDETYYNCVKVTETYRETVIREITFPDAFIKSYQEEINPHTGHGEFVLLLMQKMDKRIDIVVEPFNEVFPTLSSLNKVEEPEAQEQTEGVGEYEELKAVIVPILLDVPQENDQLSSAEDIFKRMSKIRLNGDKDERRLLVNLLQSLTNTELVHVETPPIDDKSYVYKKIEMQSSVDGNVLGTEGADLTKAKPLGTKLIQEILLGDKLFDIYVIYKGDSGCAFPTKNGCIVNGQRGSGVDPDIYINPNMIAEGWICDLDTGKTVKEENAKDSIVFGHELIHAFYMSRGESLMWEGKSVPYTYIDQNNKIVTAEDSEDELYTVGIIGDREYTENGLRQEHIIGVRVRYGF